MSPRYCFQLTIFFCVIHQSFLLYVSSYLKSYDHKFQNIHFSTINSKIDTNHDLDSINRDEFPILQVDAYPGKKLVYLDSAASSQKPLLVLNKMDDYYKTSHSNVHRGAHSLAMKATTLYEWSRDQVQKFIHAKNREEIIFTRGATEAINIVASSYSTFLKPGDEIILSIMEHHSNHVPWQMVAQRTGAVLKFVNMTANMEFDYNHYLSLLSDRTKLVCVSHSSNVLGNINPVADIIKMAHTVNAKVLIDACQSVPHMPVNVQQLDVDFLVASGHKMCGPTGIGFLYGKLDLLSIMPPVYGGGEMIDRVELFASTYAQPPSRFEAGTPAIAEAIGLGAACEYLMNIGMKIVFYHDLLLGHYLYQELSKVDGLTLYGPKPKYTLSEIRNRFANIHTNEKEDDYVFNADRETCSGLRTGLVAFNCQGIHPTDLSFFMDQEGVALRTGHHCK